MEPPSKRRKISGLPPNAIYSRNQHPRQQHETGTAQHSRIDSVSVRPKMDFSRRSISSSLRKLKHDSDPIDSQRRSRQRRQEADVALDAAVVSVEVSVQVDEQGNTIGVITAPAVALPTVPAVPQFPSDFTVPAVPSLLPVAPVTLPAVPPYPFVTAGDQASVSPPAATDNPTQSNDVTGAAAQTTVPSSSPTRADASSTSSPASLSDIESSTLATSLASSLPSISNTETTITLTGVTTVVMSDASQSDVFGVPGTAASNGAPGAATGVAESTDDSNGGDRDGPDTPAVVGGVVGGIAGIALLLGLALVILRWVKLRRRGGALQLDEGDNMETGPLTMSERNSFMPPAAAAFINRFSGASKETDISSQERGFQRISGRKLPSAFSPGMSIEEARDMQNLSQSSFYRDSQGFYSGSGGLSSRNTAGATVVGLSAADKEMMMPSPARTPVVQQSPYGFVPTSGPGAHTSGASTLSPPHSPLPQVRGTLGRSHPSFDGSRGSKFTEDV